MTMKKERILIYQDKNKSNEFENSVEATQVEAERLITTFEAFQPWRKITSFEDFIDLVTNPKDFYDTTLQGNSGIDTKATSGKLPAPAMVAKLLDLDYDNYIAIISGKKVTDTCKPCNSKAKIIKTGSGVLSYTTYKQYEKYLIWNGNGFNIDEDAVLEKKETFNFYAETSSQIACVNFWHNACDTLNELAKRGLLGGDLNSFSKTLNGRITFSFQGMKFSVDQQTLLYEIQSLKN